MGVVKPVLMTMTVFQETDNFSGEVHVRPGSRTRRGVRRQGRRASCNSLEELAGTVATSGATAGGSAHTSAAHAASGPADTELAKPKAKNAERTPMKRKKEESKTLGTAKSGGDGKGPIESLFEERAMLDGGDPLPEDGPGFVDSVNDYIDLVRTTELLLRGFDEKSTKNLMELLLEMKYGKTTRAGATRTHPVIDCVPQVES